MRWNTSRWNRRNRRNKRNKRNRQRQSTESNDGGGGTSTRRQRAVSLRMLRMTLLRCINVPPPSFRPPSSLPYWPSLVPSMFSLPTRPSHT
jgi:hypothetical protein